jgi:lantibiotic biosynthesis protein
MNELLIPTYERLHAIVETQQPESDSLLGGGLGLSLYFFSRYQAWEKEEDAGKAADWLERAVEQLDGTKHSLFGSSFAAGGSGLGYMMQLLYKHGVVEFDLEEDLAELDEFLFNQALQQIKTSNNHDFLHGALGVVHYFAQRLPEEKMENYIRQLLGLFIAKVIEEPEGTWFRNFVIVENDPDDINFSLSHGNASFLIILMNAWEKGIKLPAIPNLVTKGVELMLHYRQDVDYENNFYSSFPATVKSHTKTDMLLSPRMAWCYGDLNVVLLLYRAAAFCSRPEWAKIADEIGALTTQRRTTESTAVSDSHFCHGAGGLVQFYDSLHRVSGGLPAYREAKEFWLNWILKSLPQELENGAIMEKQSELLEGVVGVALVLLYVQHPEKINWQESLLL